MKLRSADLTELWEQIKIRFEVEGKTLPWRWRKLYACVHWIFVAGARG